MFKWLKKAVLEKPVSKLDEVLIASLFEDGRWVVFGDMFKDTKTSATLTHVVGKGIFINNVKQSYDFVEAYCAWMQQKFDREQAKKVAVLEKLYGVES